MTRTFTAETNAQKIDRLQKALDSWTLACNQLISNLKLDNTYTQTLPVTIGQERNPTRLRDLLSLKAGLAQCADLQNLIDTLLRTRQKPKAPAATTE